MDTASVTTTIQTITTASVTQEISQALTPLLWVLLIIGWLMYWLKKLNQTRIAKADLGVLGYLQCYVSENWIEIPTSLLCCLTLALNADLPPSTMDTVFTKISVFMMGYSNGSIINTVITSQKDKVPILKKISDTIAKPKDDTP